MDLNDWVGVVFITLMLLGIGGTAFYMIWTDQRFGFTVDDVTGWFTGEEE